MERKLFLRNGLAALGIGIVAPLASCKKDVDSTEAATGTGTGTGSCTVAPTETEGPFPTKSPSSYVRSDITDGRVGAKMTAKITIGNVSDSCKALAGAIVDVWHCDADGNYSEYGGTGMQSTNYQAVHFLRGRQVTDANGLVTFTTIFPGWYSGRATHIHVHVYNSAGKSLKVTQIAFNDDLCVSVNTNGSSYGYKKGTSGYTKNASDNVFSDDTAGAQIATITGSLSAGYDLTMRINVSV